MAKCPAECKFFKKLNSIETARRSRLASICSTEKLGHSSSLFKLLLIQIKEYSLDVISIFLFFFVAHLIMQYVEGPMV